METPTNGQPLYRGYYVALIDVTLVFVYREPPSRLLYLLELELFNVGLQGQYIEYKIYIHTPLICKYYSSASFELRLRKDKGPEVTGTWLMMICPSENSLKAIAETPLLYLEKSPIILLRTKLFR